MSKILLGAAVGLMLCHASAAQNNDKETIEGNGKLVTRDIPVKAFENLEANGVYELKLIQGSTETVKIEADENLQDLFQVRNEGSRLIIDMKKGYKNLRVKNKMKVYITFKKLKMLELKTVGNVTSENQLAFEDLQLNNKSVGNVDLNLTANKINMENKSVGNVTLTGKAQNAVMMNNGVGNLNAGSFVVQTLNIDNTGVGSAEVNAEKELKVKDSFLGKVKNNGSAPMRKMNKVVI